MVLQGGRELEELLLAAVVKISMKGCQVTVSVRLGVTWLPHRWGG